MSQLHVSAPRLLFLLPLPGTWSCPQQEPSTLPNDGQKDRQMRKVVQGESKLCLKTRRKAPPFPCPSILQDCPLTFV